MYVHLVCGGCTVLGPRAGIGALTLLELVIEYNESTNGQCLEIVVDNIAYSWMKIGDKFS